MTGAWVPSLGAIPHAGGTAFRVWAPDAEPVLILFDGANEREVRLTRDGEYLAASVPGAGPGTRYAYRVAGVTAPDPCSRSQPDGVHGPSEVVDPAAFAWTDGAWQPPPFASLVLYECHIGAFTAEGTFDAAIAQLPHLVDLGVTAIEVMPVASFPGARNWGYDGVSLFAPAAVYGGPDGFRRFIDAAHGAGLAVVLDVVYNHLGPDGNYTGLYSPRYTTPRHKTPWGDALNFDDDGSEHVRRFFAENLLHWVHEYHVDGFRFDATHEIADDSATHILAELAAVAAAHPRAGHVPYLTAETHENDRRYLLPRPGGFGFDAVWADDFHHGVRTLVHGERDGYLGGFAGTAAELARTIRQGWLYEGQCVPGSGEPRGTPARGLPPPAFIYCIQNHDQVGNRALGLRLNTTASLGDYAAASALLLLLPATPLLFQGQEFAASTPFQYFTDHEPGLGARVTEGRRHEFAAFAAFTDAAVRELIPDPQAESTFLDSKLPWAESDRGAGRLIRGLYRELLRLRATDPVLAAARDGRTPLDARAIGERAIVVEVANAAGTRLIVANFGEALEVPLPGSPRTLLCTDEGRFGGFGRTPAAAGNTMEMPAHAAALFAAI
ncbi:MAG: malto-oligosyltrehalose trehalohydrolase [Dehalococcoidia bacterium]|nr:malto-oligosyltrehalose trehalohydrolase [Dehalococcoidia bacterium]